jgi:hypothetical protein
LYNNDGGDVSVIGIANNVKSLSWTCLRGVNNLDETEGFGNTLCNWIPYIGNKHPDVKRLKISYSAYGFQPPLLNSIKDHYIYALSHMKHISSYSTRVYPHLSSEVVKTFNNNEAALNDISLNFSSNEQAQHDLMTALAASTIRRLDISYDMRKVNGMELVYKLKTLCQTLNYLTQLDIYGTAHFTIYILQNTPTIRSLN